MPAAFSRREKGRIIKLIQNYTMNIIDKIALLLIIIGGLNWGSVGLFSYDFVAGLFGQMSLFSRIIYDLVGLAAVYAALALLAKD